MIENTEITQTKAAHPWTENAASKSLQANDNKSAKWRTTLSHLLIGPRHRFDAESWGDHALPSTISGLNRNYGLIFDREWREVPTRFGKPCRVKAYWVASDSRERAIELVAKPQKCGVIS
jgi:hypothetical protein